MSVQERWPRGAGAPYIALSLALAAGVLAAVAPGAVADSHCVPIDPPASIQAAVDAAAADDTVCLGTGTFNQNVVITKALTLEGAGSASTTISAPSGDAVLVNLSAPDGTVRIEGLSVTTAGSTGIQLSSSTVLGTLELVNVDASGSPHKGVATGSNTDLSTLVVTGSTFSGNGTGGAGGSADLSLKSFAGDATLTDVTITGGAAGGPAHYAIELKGTEDCGAPTEAIGTVTLIRVSISGAYQQPPLYIQCYTDLAGMSFTDVTVDGPTGSGWAEMFVGSIHNGTSTPTLDLGNTTFLGTNATNISLGSPTTNLVVDATGVFFGAALASSDLTAAEDAVSHQLDLGLADAATRGLVRFVAEPDPEPSPSPSPSPAPQPQPAPEPDPTPTPPPPAATIEANPGETVEAGTDEVTTSITVPRAGTVSVRVSVEVTEDPVEGLRFLDFQTDIEAPEATPDEPLVLDFVLNAAVVPEGTSVERLVVLRNGVPVPACTGPAGIAEPDPCVTRRSQEGGVGFTVLTSRASAWTVAEVAGACPGGLVPDAGFTDVGPGVHAGAVDCLAWWDVTAGTSATAYSPGDRLTRAQLATQLARSLEAAGVALPADPADRFADDDGSPHERAVDRLAELGVLRGLEDGRYGPGRAVTRGQMATAVVAAYEFASGTALPAGGNPFTDDDGDVHEANIGRAAQPGFTSGTSATTFDPHSAVNCGQAATFVTGLLDRLVTDRLATPPL